MVFLNSCIIFVATFWSVIAIYLARGRNKVHILSQVAPSQKAFPGVTIIIPVRNEEDKLREALQTVLSLNYEKFNVIAVNDRSTDNSQIILRELAGIHPNLSIVEVTDLPPGWLGKNHALHLGYLMAKEDWILFTDADVFFEKDTLLKAMDHVDRFSLQHLTVMPQVTSPSPILNALLGTFVMMLELKHKPWRVRDQNSEVSLGVGAFNLVSRAAYEKSGMHQAIALRPDDDLKLGEIMKKSGARSDALYGDGQIWLEWYSSVSAFIDGLMKNTFAVFDYKWWRALIIGAVPVMIIFIFPAVMPFLGTIGLTCYSIILISHFTLFRTNRGIYRSWWHFLTPPFSGLVMLFIILTSMVKTLMQGGIYWRGTFYPLPDLRKNNQ